MMKVLAGIVLIALCISSALCQTNSITRCIRTSLAGSPERLPSNCSETNTLIRAAMTNLGHNDAALEVACKNECSRMLNDVLVEDCGVSYVNLLCARDSDGLCFSTAGEARVSTDVSDFSDACYKTNCSDSACNSSANSLPCCASSNLQFLQILFGPLATIIPEGCSLPDICSGGVAVFATPAALLAALIAALAALF